MSPCPRTVPVALLLASIPALAQPCDPVVEPLRTGFGLDAPARHSAIFDEDGPGPAPARLFLSGEFTSAGGLSVPGLVRWDGSSFSAVQGAPAGPKGAMRVFDDGSGLAIYIASTPGIIHRYRAGSWNTLAIPRFNALDGVPLSFAALDPDNQGPRPMGLFALIHYPGLPGEATAVLWRYDQQGWYRLSGPVPSGKIVAYDADGPGPGVWEIYHYFNITRPSPQRTVGYMYRLRQDHWEFITHTSGTDPLGIQDAAVFYSAPFSPPRLVIAGGFSNLWRTGLGWLPTARVALWDGTALRSVPQSLGTMFRGTAVAPWYGSSTPRLIVGGPAAAGIYPYSLWETQWSPIQPGTRWFLFDSSGREYVNAEHISLIREFDPDGPGPGPHQLVLSGDINFVGGRAAENFATWTPTGGFASCLDGPHGTIRAFQVFSDSSGRRLYAAGSFSQVGRRSVRNIARWDGAQWQPVGEGLAPGWTSSISSLATHNDGSGWALYAAVSWSGGVQARANVARWNGSTWSFVTPTGASGPSYSPPSLHIVSHDEDGPGPLPARLYAAGNFSSFAGIAAAKLAVWNGLVWAAVPGILNNNAQVYTLKSLNEGSGPALYIGGDGLRIEGLAPSQGYRLRAGMWESLPEFPPSPHGPYAWVLTDFALESSTGEYRLVAVYFTSGFEGRSVFRLDGGAWTDLHAPPDMDGDVARHIIDASGPSLIVGRHRYTGAGWERLDPFPVGPPSIVDPPVRAISPVFDDGGGPSFFIGGSFSLIESEHTGLTGTGRIARVRLCAPFASGPCPANCDGSTASPLLNIADFTCFLQRYAADDPYANCDGSTAPPVLNVADFTCFLQRYAVGCN